ncbi:hypothetical protein Tco_1242660 [Tanacetum coccineum]
MRTRSQARKRRQQQVRQTSVESPNLEKPNPPIVTMDDNRTMAELLQAPTEGYDDRQNCGNLFGTKAADCSSIIESLLVQDQVTLEAKLVAKVSRRASTLGEYLRSYTMANPKGELKAIPPEAIKGLCFICMDSIPPHGRWKLKRRVTKDTEVLRYKLGWEP